MIVYILPYMLFVEFVLGNEYWARNFQCLIIHVLIIVQPK